MADGVPEPRIASAAVKTATPHQQAARDAQRWIPVLSASIGAGHDGVARELCRRLTAEGYAVEQIDFLDILPARMGALVRAAYHRQLNAAPDSWTWVVQGVGGRGATRLAAVMTALCGRGLAEFLTGAEVVVSTHPAASQVLGRLRAQRRLDCPTVTFLTDMSVHPLWVNPGIDVHLALHPVAAAQAMACGALDVRVTGPLVGPAFRPAASAVERAAARSAFGLPADRALALVVAGSWGVGEIESSVAELAATGLVTPVVACGSNDALRERLSTLSSIALGWVDDMPTLLRACDVVVQNAGGLTSLEARATGLPVVTYRPLAGHGRTNAAALESAGWAAWPRDADQLTATLRHALRLDPSSTEGSGSVPQGAQAAPVSGGGEHPERLSEAPLPRTGIESIAAAERPACDATAVVLALADRRPAAGPSRTVAG